MSNLIVDIELELARLKLVAETVCCHVTQLEICLADAKKCFSVEDKDLMREEFQKLMKSDVNYKHEFEPCLRDWADITHMLRKQNEKVINMLVEMTKDIKESYNFDGSSKTLMEF